MELGKTVTTRFDGAGTTPLPPFLSGNGRLERAGEIDDLAVVSSQTEEALRNGDEQLELLPWDQKNVYAIGVDLGGTHFSVGLVDTAGRIQKGELVEQDVDNLAPPEETLGAIAESIRKILHKGYPVRAVGIGLPGDQNSALGICRFSPNFPAWHNVEVAPFLSAALKLPVYMLNDARAATLGEFYFGSGRGTRNVVMITVGTGIGGGVILNKELYLGKDEAAGEIGHMTIEPHGPLCHCGNQGCLEALASGPAIAARGAQAVSGRPVTRPKILEDLARDRGEMSAKVVSDAAREGDPIAQRILREAGQALGIGIANLAVAYNPDRFIIGGGVSRSGDLFISAIRDEVNRRLRIIPPESVSVVPAALGVHAGPVIGAATYAFLKSGIKLRC